MSTESSRSLPIYIGMVSNPLVKPPFRATTIESSLLGPLSVTTKKTMLLKKHHSVTLFHCLIHYTLPAWSVHTDPWKTKWKGHVILEALRAWYENVF